MVIGSRRWFGFSLYFSLLVTGDNDGDDVVLVGDEIGSRNWFLWTPIRLWFDFYEI